VLSDLSICQVNVRSPTAQGFLRIRRARLCPAPKINGFEVEMA
jgi:hypothetical protein